MRIFSWFHSFSQDIVYAARGLRKSPGFLAVVVFSLALGVGANSAIFSVIDNVLLRPLPFDHPEQLVTIWEMPLDQPTNLQWPPIAELTDWQTQNHVFSDIALTSFTEPATLAGLGAPQSIRTQWVTPDFFTLLHTQPLMGRVFLPEEMQDRAETVIISDTFWKSQLQSDPHVLGKTVTIEGVVATVVGVMPPRFAPFDGNRIDVWQPINAQSSRYAQRIDHWLMPVARLKPGVTMQHAQNEMNVVANRIALAYPQTNKNIGKKLQPLRELLTSWIAPWLYPLLGAVGFVLLIACVNVANLLQSRAETRRSEYAVRASLGASRGRLIQQLLAESLLLSLLGSALGILFSYVGIRIFLSLAGEFPDADSITVDSRVLLFTLAISLLTAILFGLAPALQSSNPNLNSTLRQGSGRTASSSRGLTRHVLAIAEVALAMVLLIGAGLMINTMLRLQRVDPGFDANNVLTMEFQLPEGGKYLDRVPGSDMEKTLPTVNAFYQQLVEKISAIPGVDSAGLISYLPTRGGEHYTFSVLGRPMPAPDSRPGTGYVEISPSFFHTLKIPLKKGRLLDERDNPSAPWAVVVNERFAQRIFPNEDPIGKQLLFRYDPYPVDEDHPRQIVGIVGDVRHFSVGRSAPSFVYTSYLQQPAIFPGGSAGTHIHQALAIRTAPGLNLAGNSLALSVKKIVSDLDPDQPINHIMPLDQVVSESLGDYRFYMQVLGIFAAIALLLAIMGIYGVMSYFVSQRTREIGIRVAIGAHSSDVLRLVTATTLKLTAIGVVVGVAMALGLTRLIASFLFGVQSTDPLTYAIVAVTLTFVALLASYIPARRATKVDPLIALRYE